MNEVNEVMERLRVDMLAYGGELRGAGDCDMMRALFAFVEGGAQKLELDCTDKERLERVRDRLATLSESASDTATALKASGDYDKESTVAFVESEFLHSLYQIVNAPRMLQALFQVKIDDAGKLYEI